MKSVEERLHQLPEIAENMGLEADEALKRKILRMAREEKKESSAITFRRLAPVLCALVLLVGAVAVGVSALHKDSVQPVPAQLTRTIAAGNGDAVPGTQLALDVPMGSIVIKSSSNPSYRSIWAKSSGGNFPLICVEGRYYRMLTNPTALPESLLGGALGQVNTFTSEPALAANGGIVSNKVNEGETVYALKGMQGAVVAAKVDGSLRAFQRVSFGENGLMGGEGLSATLQAKNVVALELTGVGTINDAETARYLMGILTDNASFLRSGSSETNTSLLIQLANGLTLQMAVNGERMMACGTWACPEFFEAFHEALQ
ncbi:MAG: hypothetical protein IJN44_00645 [Clostridia bacterium]|nr:hypothetical protein [Clostridia bacterium]